MRLVLASGSPRRKELLEREGFEFEIRGAGVEELEGGALPAIELARENARLKAEAVVREVEGAVVLGADTVVVIGGETLGKPADLGEGAGMLRKLSGNWHEVVTGVALKGGGMDEIFHEVTRVRFKELSEADIAAYHARVEVLDKAGGYAIQDGGEIIIAEVEGCGDNVMGLPVERVKERLVKLER